MIPKNYIKSTPILLFFLLFLSNNISFSQSVALDWVNKIDATGSIGFGEIEQDKFGNYYILGSFGGVCDFDPSSSVFSVTSVGSFDGFILKLNATGDFLWVKTIGGNDPFNFQSITINAQDEIFVSGNFSGGVFLPQTSPTSYLNSNGSTDWFVMKIE